MNNNKELDATTKFKLYLNSIINDVDDKIHNELWNHLIDCIMEKEQLKRREEDIVESIRKRIKINKVTDSPENKIKNSELESMLKFILTEL